MTNLTDRDSLAKPMRLFLFSLLLFWGWTGGFVPPAAAKPVQVVTTTTVLKHFVEVLGKDRVRVYSIGKPYQDPHLSQATPRDILRIRKAQIFIWTGSDEEEWTEAAVKSAGNSKLIVVDASKGITWLDVPDRKTIASGEHIHTKGNPYYWMDPLNGPIILGNIAQALAFVSSKNREFIQSNQRSYEATLRARLEGWKKRAAPLEGRLFVSYHDIWPYFAKRFKLKMLRPIEPRPGIPPSPKSLKDLISEMQLEDVRLVLQVPFYSSTTPSMVARSAGAKVVVMPISLGKKHETETYLKLFDRNIEELLRAAGDG